MTVEREADCSPSYERLTTSHLSSAQVAFLRRVERLDGCWPWLGEKSRDGYGMTRVLGPHTSAHRAAYTLFVGPVADDHDVDHVKALGCLRRDCVNPAHLQAVPHAENMRRMRRPTTQVPAQSHCTNGHEYTLDNTYWRADGCFYCRECARVGNAIRRQNVKASDVRLDTVDALAEATALHLRMLGRWQPGTIAALLRGGR